MIFYSDNEGFKNGLQVPLSTQPKEIGEHTEYIIEFLREAENLHAGVGAQETDFWVEQNKQGIYFYKEKSAEDKLNFRYIKFEIDIEEQDFGIWIDRIQVESKNKLAITSAIITHKDGKLLRASALSVTAKIKEEEEEDDE